MCLGLVFGEADPGDFGVGVSDAGDDSCGERGRYQLLFALQFTCYYFRSYVRFLHGLVRQHGLADDVAHEENVGHVGAHLNIDVDKVTLRNGHTGFVRQQSSCLWG